MQAPPVCNQPVWLFFNKQAFQNLVIATTTPTPAIALKKFFACNLVFSIFLCVLKQKNQYLRYYFSPSLSLSLCSNKRRCSSHWWSVCFVLCSGGVVVRDLKHSAGYGGGSIKRTIAEKWENWKVSVSEKGWPSRMRSILSLLACGALLCSNTKRVALSKVFGNAMVVL